MMVGARGFEPPTSASRTLRANQAALRPDSYIISGFNLFYQGEIGGEVDKGFYKPGDEELDEVLYSDN